MATATVEVTIRNRCRWVLPLAVVASVVCSPLPAHWQEAVIDWLWARVRYEMRVGERGAWQHVRLPDWRRL